MLGRAKIILAGTLRVRLTSHSCCSSTWTCRDFYLDWLALKVYYGP